MTTKHEHEVLKDSLRLYATKKDFSGIVENMTEFVRKPDFNVLQFN